MVVPTLYYTERFERWLNGLRDREASQRIVLRLRRAEQGNLGDVAPVGEGVSEMRLDFGRGYRMYFTRIGRDSIALLCGGTKARQDRDIRLAKRLARQLEE